MPDEAGHTAGQSADLAAKIVAALGKKGGQKAAELARTLGTDRREVNRCLNFQLAGKVQQDSAYRWSLSGARAPQPAQPAAEPTTEIGRLTRYYLECIAQDAEQGVSTFASNSRGATNYAELRSVPLPGSEADWWNEAGVSRILGQASASRGKAVAYIGYPVLLREHQTPTWRGYFVEPVMLWQIALRTSPGDTFELADDLPSVNFKFLRSLTQGRSSELMEEAARLSDDLGLNRPIEDSPDVDELLLRLQQVRPDWSWRETLDPEHCSDGPLLSELTEPGIYNRAIVIAGERSPYTQGLEAELKELGKVPDAKLASSALGMWLSGNFARHDAADSDPLIEVLPMNSEQREAVHRALVAPLTVVTGPPGTGKSQVVTDLLVNATWRNKKVLFASKNNKAVDVVEARVNGLGRRPVLLRIGSREYQAKLSDYMTAMLSGNVTQHDEVEFSEAKERHAQLADRLRKLDQAQENTLRARNTADSLDAAAEDHRALFGAKRFNSIDPTLLRQADFEISQCERAIDAADGSRHRLLGKLVWSLTKPSRLQAVTGKMRALAPLAANLGVMLPAVETLSAIPACRQSVEELRSRVTAAREVLKYQQALEVLRSSPSFEDIARQRQQLSEQIARNSDVLWRAYVQLTPKRLSAAQRKEVADYAAVLQLMTGQDSQNIAPGVRSRAKALQANVVQLFSCWAVTSLSARGRIPFEAGYFDLVVIDEASQCDIASALPLLYRAKRAVIIGDPKQLRHISSLSKRRDSELQEKYGLVETRVSWMYSVQSLYDLAAAIVEPSSIVNLRDHHRSHADIINFANETFYGGRLRVATRYDFLKRPHHGDPGVVWHDVRGQTRRPPSGGADNLVEAKVLLSDLRELVLNRGFRGTVGVVTPFRAQVQLLERLLSEDQELSAISASLQLLIDTVHRFQGDERDVMFFSPVISADAPSGALSFLRANGNLFNVAITRARGLLQVVGDIATARCSGIDYLEAFAKYAGELAARRTRERDAAESADFGPEYPAVSRPERVSDWERLFYRALYNAGVRAIPQYQVDQYDLDFAVFAGARRLDLEVDGERYHRSWTGELCLRDQLRNQRMIELGWEVKRFWVYEIRDRLDECVEWVAGWAKQSDR